MNPDSTHIGGVREISISKEYRKWLDNGDYSSLNKRIQKLLTSDGHKIENVSLRFVRTENLATIVEQGTDRTMTLEDQEDMRLSFEEISLISDRGIHETYGLEPCEFIYVVNQIDLDNVPVMYGKEIRRVQTKSTVPDEAQKESWSNAVLMLVYDNSMLEDLKIIGHSTVRKFKTSPKDSLLQVYHLNLV